MSLQLSHNRASEGDLSHGGEDQVGTNTVPFKFNLQSAVAWFVAITQASSCKLMCTRSIMIVLHHRLT